MSKRQSKLSSFFKPVGQPDPKLAKVVPEAEPGSADTGGDSIIAAEDVVCAVRSTDKDEGAVTSVHEKL